MYCILYVFISNYRSHTVEEKGKFGKTKAVCVRTFAGGFCFCENAGAAGLSSPLEEKKCVFPKKVKL